MTTNEEDAFLAALPDRLASARKVGHSSGLTCEEVQKLLDIIDRLNLRLRLIEDEALEDRS